MWQRWMVVHKVVLRTVLPVLRRLPYRLAHGFLSLMGRLDLRVVPHQTKLYESAVADMAKRLECDWNVRAVSRALARQTYRWRVRDLLLEGRSDERIAPLFRVSGRDRLDAALAEGKGVLLLANHFGSHVLMTHWLFRQGYPLRWLGEKPRNISSYLTRQFATDGPLGQANLFVSRTALTAEAASTVYHASRVLRGNARQGGLRRPLARCQDGDCRFSRPYRVVLDDLGHAGRDDGGGGRPRLLPDGGGWDVRPRVPGRPSTSLRTPGGAGRPRDGCDWHSQLSKRKSGCTPSRGTTTSSGPRDNTRSDPTSSSPPT